jgi:hypothetical protein
MPLLPTKLFLAFLLCLAWMAGASSLRACSGDQYWEADPEGTLTWYTRGPEIPIRVSLPKAQEVIREALQNARVPSCDSEKDLTSQRVKVLRAFRTGAIHTRIPAGFVPHQDYSQLMVRILSRGADDYAAQILTRTKWGQGREQPSQKADQEEHCAAAAIAEKIRANLAPLTAGK